MGIFADEPRRIDPREAHLIPTAELTALMPGVPNGHLDAIRGEFARWLSSRAGSHPFPSWREAMDAWSGARPHDAGVIEYRTHRCDACRHGLARRPDMRSAARGAHPMVCSVCGGTGRGRLASQRALFAGRPQQSE